MTFKSGLKINLNLQITGRRENSYHELSSLVVFCQDAGDDISLQSDAALKSDDLKITGQFAKELQGEDISGNLIIKALHILRRQNPQLPFFKMNLSKNIPVASGLGGGSCDAAAVIRQVARYYNLEIDKEMFLPLGADLPVCLSFKNVIMRGIGERLEPLKNIPAFYILLVNPLKKISAGEAYNLYKQMSATFSPEISSPPLNEDFSAWASYLNSTNNDLLAPAISLCPDIKKVIHMLQTCDDSVFAGMSGSGATCFALFKSEESVINALQTVPQQFKDNWIYTAKIAKN
jgi:4-diphosphocytidyl-2-C-methyl-D-erythritol kinase